MSRRFYMDFEKPVVELEQRLNALKEDPLAGEPDIHQEIIWLEGQIAKLKVRTYSNLTAWQKVQVARHPMRPRLSAYIKDITTDWQELRGDRAFRDDPAITGGLARIGGVAVVLVGQDKGADTRDRIHRNFGSPHPEGYRKAIRFYQLAAKFRLPVVTFIDTPGAYAGIEAEERGQAWAIAESLRVLSELPVPVVAVNIGEGGSGGALALGVADHLIMLENSYYSVITPEGCAAILWKSKEKAADAAAVLGLTAAHLLNMEIIDEVIEEPLGGAHRDQQGVTEKVATAIGGALERLIPKTGEELTSQRYERFRRLGAFVEAGEKELGLEKNTS